MIHYLIMCKHDALTCDSEWAGSREGERDKLTGNQPFPCTFLCFNIFAAFFPWPCSTLVIVMWLSSWSSFGNCWERERENRGLDRKQAKNEFCRFSLCWNGRTRGCVVFHHTSDNEASPQLTGYLLVLLQLIFTFSFYCPSTVLECSWPLNLLL